MALAVGGRGAVWGGYDWEFGKHDAGVGGGGAVPDRWGDLVQAGGVGTAPGRGAGGFCVEDGTWGLSLDWRKAISAVDCEREPVVGGDTAVGFRAVAGILRLSDAYN